MLVVLYAEIDMEYKNQKGYRLMTNYIVVSKENMGDFVRVLPPWYYPSENRITLAAYKDDGTILGAVSLALAGDEYNLDWLYVLPGERGKKVATGLMDEIFKFIGATVEVYPLKASFEVDEKEESLFGFFLSEERMDTGYSHERFYVTPEELRSSQKLNREVEVEFDELYFFRQTKKEQKKLFDEISDGNRYVIEDRTMWEESCIPELCRVLLVDGKVTAAIFIVKRTDGNLELSWLYSKNPICMKKLISVTARDIEKKYPKSKLIFDTVGEGTESMAQKLFPKSKTVHIYEADW